MTLECISKVHSLFKEAELKKNDSKVAVNNRRAFRNYQFKCDSINSLQRWKAERRTQNA